VPCVSKGIAMDGGALIVSNISDLAFWETLTLRSDSSHPDTSPNDDKTT
jgi:hypothetical protein